MHFKKFIVWLSSPILLGRLEARKEERGGADKGKDAMNRSRKNVPYKSGDIPAGAGLFTWRLELQHPLKAVASGNGV